MSAPSMVSFMGLSMHDTMASTVDGAMASSMELFVPPWSYRWAFDGAGYFTVTGVPLFGLRF